MCASSRPPIVRLRQAIGEGRFREDLYYRLNILTLVMPPLRERPDDIERLAHHFLRAVPRHSSGATVAGYSPEAMDVLRQHDWPGNVRELAAVIRRAVVIGDAPVVMRDDLTGLDAPPPRAAAIEPRPAPGSAAERAALLETLVRTQENITMAAHELGVSRVTMYRMLRRHGIELRRGLKSPPVRN